jgi:hypothetical protein
LDWVEKCRGSSKKDFWGSINGAGYKKDHHMVAISFPSLTPCPPEPHFIFSVLLLLSHPVSLGNLDILRQESKQFRISSMQRDAFQAAPPA